MEAFGIPECFIRMVRAMYADGKTRFKVGGVVDSEPVDMTSGTRQGCALSSLLFLLMQEILLRMIRKDESVRGIDIPGPEGSTKAGETEEITERALTDDLAVYLRNPREGCTALRKIFEKFEVMSGLGLNVGKCQGLLVGMLRDLARAAGTGAINDPQIDLHTAVGSVAR